MNGALGLRAVAVLIALAGAADPVVSIERPARQPMTVAILDTPSLSLPDGAATRRDRAYGIAQSLQRDLAGAFEISVREHPIHTAAAPCPADAACIVISDGRRPRRIGDRTAPLGAVRIDSPIDRNVAIDSVRSTSRTSLQALGVVTVDLSARGIAGQTALEVRDGGVLVGQGAHDWPAGSTTSSARVRVEWTPVAEGIRELTVVARPVEGERTIADNSAHVAVGVTARPVTVLVHEPRPSWSGTFIRRAIAGDRRFRLISSARLGGALAIETAQVPLQMAALTRNEVAVVVITAPELLVSREVDAIDQFARLRGGSVVLVVDAPLTGSVRRLLPFSVTPRAERNPVALGSLRASEFMTFQGLDLSTTVLTAAGNWPAIVARNIGSGQVVAYGAGDAWRYREEGDGFARYWRSLIADAAEAAGDPLIVTLSTSAPAPGEQVGVDVEWRSLEVPELVEARAVLECDGQRALIRLWPSHAPNRFAGWFAAPASGRCQVQAAMSGGVTATAPLAVVESIAPMQGDRDELSSAIVANGGMVVSEDQQPALVTAFRQSASRKHSTTLTYLMRSPWWIIPVAACLGGEWWWRRRRGQR